MEGVNVAVITGNCTRDPELRYTESGTAICQMRVAVNSSRKNAKGEWVDKPNYIDVTVFGKRAEASAEHLSKGSPVAVEGRLDWSEWEAKDGSGKRQRLQIIANLVRFLGTTAKQQAGTSTQGRFEPTAPESTDWDPEPVTAGVAAGSEEDIPF